MGAEVIVPRAHLLEVRGPASAAIPLVLDSPHSGHAFPDDFNAAVSEAGLREGEDCNVEELFAGGPELGAPLRAVLAGMGYQVKVNDPYKGVELVRVYSDPRAGRHSLQIEINKRLYMNEATMGRTEGFAVLHKNFFALL